MDVCIITKGKYEMLRNYKHDNFKVFSKAEGYKFKEERVTVLEEVRHKIVVEAGEMPMEIS